MSMVRYCYIMKEQQAIIINPDSPYLLDASFEAFKGSVEKSIFGEGEEYSNFKKIHHEAVEESPASKVFFSYEACGLTFV